MSYNIETLISISGSWPTAMRSNGNRDVRIISLEAEYGAGEAHAIAGELPQINRYCAW